MEGKIKICSWDSWLISDQSAIKDISDTEKLVEAREQAVIAMYRVKSGGFNILSEIPRSSEKRQVKIDLDIVTDNEVTTEVGIVKLIANQAGKTEYYKIQEFITIDVNEAIDAMYLCIRIYGTGIIKLNEITIDIITKVDEVIRCNQKVEDFRRWYKKNIQSYKSIQPHLNVRVACILDSFSFRCLKDEVELKAISYNNWEADMETFKPQLLLVESAWQGSNKEWIGKVARYNQRYDTVLLQLITYCRKKGIPTFFWDKEGMNNLYYFIHTSSLFDYIGMTDENLWPIYKAMHPEEKLCILPFAAGGRLHVKELRKTYPLGEIAFAGSWYGNKYRQRLKDIEVVLDPTLKYGVDIYDRNYGNSDVNSEFEWPQKYQPYIVGNLPYEMMIEAYTQYSIYLNIQSIQESNFMISRRVYELLACGTPIISTPSKGILYQFQENIYTSRTPEETIRHIKWIQINPQLVEEKAAIAREKILTNHTYKQRMEQILKLVGIM